MLRKIKDLNGYILFQSEATGKLYVEVPAEDNEELDIYPEGTSAIPLKRFLKQGIIAVITDVLYQTQVSAKVVYIKERELIISSHSRVYKHSVHYEGAIKLIMEKDKVNGILPVILTTDRDGNFFSIASTAVIVKDMTIYQSHNDHITSIYVHDEVPIINSFAACPHNSFLKAARCLTAVVDFSKRIFSHN